MQPILTLTIQKLVHGGQGMARSEKGQVVFVWNALPGEVVRAQVIKQKKDYLEAIAIEILEASPNRIEPKDEHYLASAAWQMMTPDAEIQAKKIIAAETYNKIAEMIIAPEQIKVVTDDTIERYRNKMEFGFCHINPEHDEDKANYHPISISLFSRGGKTKIPVQDASIASKEIMAVAKQIEDWVNDQKIPLRSLKSVIVRSSQKNENKQCIAALFIKDKLTYPTYPKLSEQFIGFELYFSTHKSPASVPTELLYSEGKNYLEQTILGTHLRYGIFSFFQINPPVFELALKDMAAFIDPKTPLVDFYSGVGAIGLPISHSRPETTLVESNTAAAEFAQTNISENKLTHCQMICGPAETLTEHISKEKVIIVDPPRAGLHPDMVKELRKNRPPTILYLSCNLSTQARDMRLLSEFYRPVFIQLYNFFPRTPHIESLVVLERI